MRSESSQTSADTARQRLKLLAWPLVAAVLFGLIAFGEIIEDGLRIARNSLRPHPVSGDIVLVEVDESSMRAFGNWPWPRATQARVIDRANRLGAKRIFMDVIYANPSDTANDRALEAALSRSDNVILAAQSRIGEWAGKKAAALPMPAFGEHTGVASIGIYYNWQGAVWKLPYSAIVDGKPMRSLSASIAGARGLDAATFPIDYSFDIDSIPRVGARDLINGKVDAAQIRGKTVVFGTTAHQAGDQYTIPGRGKRGGVYIHILGAETLKAGRPIDLGWMPALLVAALATAWGITGSRRRSRLALAGTSLALLLFPFMLEWRLIFVDVTPALFLTGVIAARLAWRRSRVRGLTNPLSGLPNLAALAADRTGKDLPLVAVRVHNYAEITSTLDTGGERQLVEQIVTRLTLGQQGRRIFQGDEGIFAWFADKGTPFSSHLDALHSLFRNPVRVGGSSIDVALSFGVEVGSSRSISSRLGSALVAADDADSESLKWKFHDPARMQDVPWRLSLLSQLDTAIENGEVWLAYQPKLDLATRRTVGAEALARWTHPDKGPISPVEFVSAAEQSDRIERLTDFVLDKAVEAAAAIAKRGIDFGIAVNLSARMLSDRRLPERVAATLDRHGLAADKLTLELTETAAVSGSGTGIELLAKLRELGVRIALDDYGTGLSTLDYLKKVPATEIKIDQSFVKAMRDNRSDMIMVQSTIGLAHSLGRTVVAEGVEDSQSLEQLTLLKCDIAQGFIIGRPMSFEEILRRLEVERRRRAA